MRIEVCFLDISIYLFESDIYEVTMISMSDQ